MTPSGDPLAPAASTGVYAGAAADTSKIQDPAFADFDKTFSMTSDELHAAAGAPVIDSSHQDSAHKDEPADVPKKEDASTKPPEAMHSPDPVSAAGSTYPHTLSQSGAAGWRGGWSVRLVSTLPQAQPPRAILGLPDGRELVVQPGTMLPDEGLVVMAIGQDRIELAAITAAGDHAIVQSLSLSSLY